jgi:hypothetical protein
MNSNLPYYQDRTKIITDHLDRFPDAPSRTIAKIMFRDYPGYFKDSEDARSAIRYRKGSSGASRLKSLKDKKYVKQIQST